VDQLFGWASLRWFNGLVCGYFAVEGTNQGTPLNPCNLAHPKRKVSQQSQEITQLGARQVLKLDASEGVVVRVLWIANRGLAVATRSRG
jgi:hypothetical protein